MKFSSTRLSKSIHFNSSVGRYAGVGLVFLCICFSACHRKLITTEQTLKPKETPEAAKQAENKLTPSTIHTGADQTEVYLPLLKGKKVGLVINRTSIIGKRPIVDSLRALGIDIRLIFGPEHGFRGNASAGTHVQSEKDSATGIPVVSLYGKRSRPSPAEMDQIDLLIFDIQDVGARFYTYINTLQYAMEACAESGKPLLILDRPNPNGFVVDGPILEDDLHSGIGIHKIPITHGLTMGEFAQMLNGEGWLRGKLHCELKIIALANYTHDSLYTLPISPSPNLNTQQAIYLYPSLCLFEGTIVSQGRGTFMPFTILGAPKLKDRYSFRFVPQAIEGMSETPLHQNEPCFGLDLRQYDVDEFRFKRQINLKWLIELYQAYPEKAHFFDRSFSRQMGDFDKLAGTRKLRKQIEENVPEAEIRKSWEPGLSDFKTLRKKYLLYP